MKLQLILMKTTLRLQLQPLLATHLSMSLLTISTIFEYWAAGCHKVMIDDGNRCLIAAVMNSCHETL